MNLPTSASFLVTENCNLRCKYCFEKHNNNVMTEEVAYKALEMLSDNAVKEHQREFHAMIFGGEPLLNIDLIDKIFHKGEDLAKEKGLRFTSTIITNATIFNEEIESVLGWHKHSSNLTLQLSIDGDKETQDEYRVTVDGKGSFDKVDENVPKFFNIFKGEEHKICIHGCLNKKTLPKMYNNFMFFIDKWKAQNIWFLPVMEENWDEEDVKIYEEQQGKIYGYIRNILIEKRDVSAIDLYAPLDRCRNHFFADKPCGAGDTFVTITANGDIYACHQMYFNDPEQKTKIGDVFEGLDEEKRKPFVKYRSSDLTCDKDCKNVNCYRCIAANFVYNGDMLNQIKGNYCKLMSVDKMYQDFLYNDAKNLGLINENPNCEYECLCNCREGSSLDGCDIVHRQEVCESGNNPDNPNCLCDVRSNEHQCNCGNENNYNLQDFEDTVSLALNIILEKLENIENKLEKLENKA